MSHLLHKECCGLFLNLWVFLSKWSLAIPIYVHHYLISHLKPQQSSHLLLIKVVIFWKCSFLQYKKQLRGGNLVLVVDLMLLYAYAALCCIFTKCSCWMKNSPLAEGGWLKLMRQRVQCRKKLQKCCHHLAARGSLCVPATHDVNTWF